MKTKNAAKATPAATVAATQEKSRKSFYEGVIMGSTEKFIPKKVKTLMAETITLKPLQAKHILKHYNAKNRKASKNLVSKYARDMRNGDWKASGEPISFDLNGNLLNGQHRLLACLEADISIQFLAVFGLSPEIFEVIDNGKIRSNADVLGMKNYAEPAILSALVRSAIAYGEEGKVDAKYGAFSGANQITKIQIIKYLEDHPEIVSFIDKYKKSQIVPSTTAAFCYWLLATDDQTKTEEFLDHVLLGYDLKPDTIEAYLFSKLQRNRNATQNKMTKIAVIANIIEGYKRFAGYSKNKSIQINWDARRGLPKIR